MAPQGTAKSKYWVFTLNNPVSLDEPKDNIRDFEYLIYQQEQGEQGTTHLQGYVAFHGRKSLASMKVYLPKAHWEHRRGTHEQAKAYCMKDESRVSGPYEFGDDTSLPKCTGERTDLIKLKVDLDKKVPLAEIASLHFGAYLKYERGIRSYMNITTKHRDGTMKPVIYIFWGPSGTGKTRQCKDKWPVAYWKSKSEWWQDYSGQDVVIFDEFYGWLPYDFLLRVLDWYALEVPYKGGSFPLCATTFVFTSNQPWEQWYPKVRDTTALRRRIEEFGTITYVTNTTENFALPKVQDIEAVEL